VSYCSHGCLLSSLFRQEVKEVKLFDIGNP